MQRVFSENRCLSGARLSIFHPGPVWVFSLAISNKLVLEFPWRISPHQQAKLTENYVHYR